AVVVGGEHDERFEDAVSVDRTDQLGELSDLSTRVVRMGPKVGQVEPAQFRLDGVDGRVGGGFGGGHRVASKVAVSVVIQGCSGWSLVTPFGSTRAVVSSAARTQASPCSVTRTRAAVAATP